MRQLAGCNRFLKKMDVLTTLQPVHAAHVVRDDKLIALREGTGWQNDESIIFLYEADKMQPTDVHDAEEDARCNARMGRSW